MYPSLGWPCSSCEFYFLHSTLGRTFFSAHRLTGSNTQHGYFAAPGLMLQTLSWLVTSVDSSTQSKFTMFFSPPISEIFSTTFPHKAMKFLFWLTLGFPGVGSQGPFWKPPSPNGFKNVMSTSTSEVSWVRRLERRRVPVTKVLGSNATMIPAALAWAVELKVRHIADFVDQKMDMRLVRTRPRGWWGWGLSEGSSAEKSTIFFLDKIRSCRRFEVRLMISPGKKKASSSNLTVFLRVRFIWRILSKKSEMTLMQVAEWVDFTQTYLNQLIARFLDSSLFGTGSEVKARERRGERHHGKASGWSKARGREKQRYQESTGRSQRCKGRHFKEGAEAIWKWRDKERKDGRSQSGDKEAYQGRAKGSKEVRK